MPSLAQSKRKKESLSLPTSPSRSRVEMNDAEPLHPSASRSASALKIPRSHGSGESFISSGCH